MCLVHQWLFLACRCQQLYDMPCRNLQRWVCEFLHVLCFWKILASRGQHLHQLLRVRDRPVQRVQLRQFGGYRVWGLHKSTYSGNLHWRWICRSNILYMDMQSKLVFDTTCHMSSVPSRILVHLQPIKQMPDQFLVYARLEPITGQLPM